MSALQDVKDRLAPLFRRIDGLSRRERLLVLITMLVTIAGLWHMLLIEPLAKRADGSRDELSSLRERIDTANQNLEEQILQLAGGGGEQRARIGVIQQRIDEINAALGDYASELIDPAEMARVLEGILRRQSGLELVRIRNLPPEGISDGDETNVTRFYRHGLEIEVEGSFAACLDYLTEIEGLPWRLYWQLLDLEVVEYPHNRIRLEVSTLSLDEEWIGA